MTQQELQAAVRRALAIFDQRVDVTGDMWSDSSYYTEMSECIEDAVHCGAQAATGDYQRLPDEAVIVPQVRVRIVAGELTQDGYTPVEEEKDRGAELEHALADLREVNQSMRGIPCPACADKDQQIEAELQTLRAYRDRICTYETTIDGLPENPHTKQGLTTFAPTFCPSCGGRVVVKQWWKPEGM